jgi:hypothetical protein
LTYGHGLPDCHVAPSEPGIIPSDYAWPEILANKIGAECVNMSEPGSSNKRIWHTLINFNFKETDIVFVLWAAVDRTCVLRTAEMIEDIGPWMDELDYYKQYHSDYDAEMQTRLYISHSNLVRPGIKNLITAKKHQHLLSLCGNTVSHIPVYLRNYVDKYPLALDNVHPGVECHRVFAEEICKSI